jgi:hypothetical protein
MLSPYVVLHKYLSKLALSPSDWFTVRNNHGMDMSLCHGGVLVEHECVCESRRVRVRRVGVCRTIIESGREREFVPPQPLVVWG